MICPRCGADLDFEWKPDGVAIKCPRCNYRTREVYTNARQVLDPFFAYRITKTND